MTAGLSRDPATVGPYRLVQQLGEGGMGIVHLALDPGGRAVALKVLRAHVATDEDARRRLAREVETLLRVRHPRIAEVIDADLTAELPYLVTRFVPGRTLEAHVGEHGPLEVTQIARLGRALGEALGAIHGAGVVHRDLKPPNVMLVDGEPVLIDFGIAHIVDESRITMAGLVMGTPGYLSPEVVDGQPVTVATDWWGWGSTLAYAATGRAPFGVGALELVLDRVRRGVADLDGVDARLRHVLEAALAVEPSARPPAFALLAGLEGLAGPAPAADARPHLALVQGAAAAPTVPQRLPGTLAYPPSIHAAGPPPAAPSLATPSPAAPPPPPPAPPARAAPPVNAPRPATAVQKPAPQPAPAATQPPAVATRGRVNGLLVATLLTLGAVAAVAPGLALTIAAVLMIAARTVDRSLAGLWRRRYEMGPRRGDVAVTILAIPWRIAVSTLASLFALLLPLLVGVSAAFVVGAARTSTGLRPDPTRPEALAVGLVAGALTAWWGPGGGAFRRGARTAVRGVGPTPRAQAVLLFVLGLVVLAAVLVVSKGTPPDLTPLHR